jgi:hypothetical protein
MKESLVSQVDSTETLAPGAAGGERVGMAYRTGNGGFVTILAADPASGCFCAVERRDAAFAAGFRNVQADFASGDFGG